MSRNDTPIAITVDEAATVARPMTAAPIKGSQIAASHISASKISATLAPRTTIGTAVATALAEPVRSLRAYASLVRSRIPSQIDAAAVAARPLIVRGRIATHAVRDVLRPWVKRPSHWWFFTGTLSRRIFTANFFGLTFLLAGFGVLTYQHTWLIDAKAESLRTQARMVAAAIAANAKLETEQIVIDPDRVSELDRTYPNWRDEAAPPVNLELQPDRFAKIVAKLTDHRELRLRVYSRAGVKMIDTGGATEAGRIERRPLAGDGPDTDTENIKNVWTRFTAWVMRSPLQVYRELGSGKVTEYPEAQAALDGAVTSVLLLNDKGEQIISAFAPVQRFKSIPGFVWLSTKPGDLEHILWRERRPFFVFSGIALLATMLASIMLRRTIGGPMRELATAAEHVSRNINARHEIPELPGRRDEIGEMAAAYRKMTAALYRRIEASDRFAQDVAHELKNPVAAARGTAEAMAYAKTDDKREEMVRQIQAELKRLNRLISDVSNASRLDAELALQETEPVDVATVVTNITDVFRELQKGRDDTPCRVLLQVEPQPAPAGTFVIEAHEGRLGQVVTNLVDNALSFSPVGGTVTVSVVGEANEVILRIDDEGPGIPPNKLDEVFARFYSDRPQSDRTSAKNSGLGLSISREIVEAHGGTIRAENRPLTDGADPHRDERPELAERRVPGVAGARFEVHLPRNAPPQPTASLLKRFKAVR